MVSSFLYIANMMV